MISKALREGLRRYVDEHIPTGTFLQYVLENDLIGAWRHADLDSRRHLSDIIEYVWNEVPSKAQGSPLIVHRWLSTPPTPPRGGKEGK